MFEAWIGPGEVPRRRRTRTSRRTAYGNATEADFLAAIEAASQPGVAAAFSTFLDQPGVPVVDVTLDCAGSAAEALPSRRSASCRVGSTGSARETWQVPVCARAALGRPGRPRLQRS